MFSSLHSYSLLACHMFPLTVHMGFFRVFPAVLLSDLITIVSTQLSETSWRKPQEKMLHTPLL